MEAPGEDSRNRLAKVDVGTGDREYFLAYARLMLGGVCTIAAYLVPVCLGRDADSNRQLILLYLVYSLFNLMVVRLHWRSGWAWEFCLRATEVLAISLIIMHTGGERSPFLGLYLFALLAAACKWGFKGALLTACVCMLLFFFLLGMARPDFWSGTAPGFLRGGNAIVASIALSTSLVLSAGILGLLLDREKKRYGDAMVIARLLRRIAPEPSFRSALGNTLVSVRECFDADQVRLAIQELGGEQAVAWEVTRLTGANENGVRSWKLTESLRQGSFAMPPERVRRWLGLGRAESVDVHSQGAPADLKRGIYRRFISGLRHSSVAKQPGDGFENLRIVSERHSPFASSWSMLATSFAFEGKWLGRLTVYSPRRGWNPRAGLRFLETLVREVGPAVYNKYLVARLRSLAQTKERLRLAQELHDGIIQSLIGLEMQIGVLRQNSTAASDPARLLEELRRVQTLLHDEIAAVREEMQRIKPLEVEPSRLLEYMAGMVDRFRREQSISASFIAKPQEIALPPRVCTELVRIVQEALANVRKHSGAHKVLVFFSREDGRYKLCVEDDGRGFGPTEPLSSAEFEASSTYPLVVTERVRAIGGELMIESTRGLGVRLEISVPVTPNGTVPSQS